MLDNNEKSYHGFYMEQTELDDKKLFIVHPKEANGHWIIKTEYFDAFPAVQLELLNQGYYLVHVENKTRWHTHEDLEARAKVVEYMHANYGLEAKCSIIGMSCGGMQGIYFASKYPEYVRCMYLDAPVVNLLSCPAGLGRGTDEMMDEFIANTGMTLIDLMSYRNHPLDHLNRLAKLNIPIILVAGDSDSVVPYDENGSFIEKAYKAYGSIIQVIIKENCDHHPHSLDDNSQIVSFINKYNR